MMMTARIVQIGFNRAGTSSIADFLRRAGYAVVDHSFDSGPLKGKSLAKIIEANVQGGQLPLHGLDSWTGFTDMEFVDEHKAIYCQNLFKEISQAHPETKFILNIRRKEDWLQSRMKFGGYLATCALVAGVAQDRMVEMWSAQWDAHLKAVTEYFTPERMLVIDIDCPDEAALSKFVGSGKMLALRQKNKAPRGPISHFLKPLALKPLMALLPQPLKNWLKNY
jgi:Sulfotransferase domain